MKTELCCGHGGKNPPHNCCSTVFSFLFSSWRFAKSVLCWVSFMTSGPMKPVWTAFLSPFLNPDFLYILGFCLTSIFAKRWTRCPTSSWEACKTSRVWSVINPRPPHKLSPTLKETWKALLYILHPNAWSHLFTVVMYVSRVFVCCEKYSSLKSSINLQNICSYKFVKSKQLHDRICGFIAEFHPPGWCFCLIQELSLLNSCTI